MKLIRYMTVYLLLIVILLTSYNNNDKKKEAEMKEPKLKEEIVSYQLNGSAMNNFVVYDDNRDGKRPAVLVIHEWWGLNDYAKMRARELAKLGYIAMAVDMYGNGKSADNPVDAQNLAMPFYQNPSLAKPIFDAALTKLKAFSQTDSAKLAAIGYCFGGAQVLNLARMGEDLKGVVSFHGNLAVTTPDKKLLKADILVCHGAADPYVPQEEVIKFKKQMDSIGAKYTFKAYEGALHAFTNPNATAIGEKFKISVKYDAAADADSWNDMKVFFSKIFQ
jgi:dienelactone hydrolase